MFCDVFLRFVMFTFWNYYVLKLLRLETITFSDATLSNINVVLCNVLSQYPLPSFADGWEIERSQTEDCLMQTPGSNMGASVSSFLKFYTCFHNANFD